ncbi:MAG: hypothetical protein ACK55Z_32240 [bacterium]
MGRLDLMSKCLFARVHLIEVKVRGRLRVLARFESDRGRLSLQGLVRNVLSQLDELVKTCFLHFDVRDKDVVVGSGHFPKYLFN